MLRAGGNGDLATICQRHHAQRVLQSLTGCDVAGNHGNGANVQFGRIQCQHEGHGIVGARISVEDDLLRRSERNLGEQKRDQKNEPESVTAASEGIQVVGLRIDWAVGYRRARKGVKAKLVRR